MSILDLFGDPDAVVEQPPESTWEIKHGDCLEVMKTMDEASVDAVVTDPPYGLAFMGKNWDHGVPGVEFWKEALRVAKPGAHLVAFGGTRTHHRLMVAIEDAGWEIRDCTMWMYGCLSEDIEALTRRGWIKGTDLTEEDDVAQWDCETKTLSWVRPEKITVAPYEGPMVHLVNEDTDQLLTPNHRVYASMSMGEGFSFGEYKVIEASTLQTWPMGWRYILPCAAPMLEGEDVDDSYAYLVGLWLACPESWFFESSGACMFRPSETKVDVVRAALFAYRAIELYLPKTGHVFRVVGPQADRLRSEFPSPSSSWSVLGWCYRSRLALYQGLMDGSGSHPAGSAISCDTGSKKHTFWSANEECRVMFQALSTSIGYKAALASDYLVHVDDKDRTILDAHNRKQLVQYTGTVWCVTVPKGAFVARRNGKVFITGNSGFPKSLDVSKAVDAKERGELVRAKLIHFAQVKGVDGKWLQERGVADVKSFHDWTQGGHVPGDKNWSIVKAALGVTAEEESAFEREILSKGKSGKTAIWSSEGMGDFDITAPATDAAKNWTGWGTALKPAWEPIILARKPLEGTVASNVMKYGTGALNIDGCRVEVSEQDVEAMDRCNTPGSGRFGSEPRGLLYGSGAGFTPMNTKMDTSKGRWPANLILDGSGEVEGLFPQTTSGSPGNSVRSTTASMLQGGGNGHPLSGFGDSGSASRYFKSTPYDENDVDAQPVKGRWPANLIVDGSEEVEGLFPQTASGAVRMRHKPSPTSRFGAGDDESVIGAEGYGDAGSASRYFKETPHGEEDLDILPYYCAKANKRDRDEGLGAMPTVTADPYGQHRDRRMEDNDTRIDGKPASVGKNFHPTVKPVALMRYLCRLVTPPGGLVLDPFCGSGSTGKAALLEGFNFVGIEREEEYVQIARSRCEHAALTRGQKV